MTYDDYEDEGEGLELFFDEEAGMFRQMPPTLDLSMAMSEDVMTEAILHNIKEMRE